MSKIKKLVNLSTDVARKTEKKRLEKEKRAKFVADQKEKTRKKIETKTKELRELYGLDDVPEEVIQKNIATREAARKSMASRKWPFKKPKKKAGGGLMKGTRAAKKAADAVVRRTKQKRKSTVSKAEIGAASGTGGAVIGTIAERSRQNRNRPSGVGKAQKGFGKAMKNGG